MKALLSGRTAAVVHTTAAPISGGPHLETNVGFAGDPLQGPAPGDREGRASRSGVRASIHVVKPDRRVEKDAPTRRVPQVIPPMEDRCPDGCLVDPEGPSLPRTRRRRPCRRGVGRNARPHPAARFGRLDRDAVDSTPRRARRIGDQGAQRHDRRPHRLPAATTTAGVGTRGGRARGAMPVDSRPVSDREGETGPCRTAIGATAEAGRGRTNVRWPRRCVRRGRWIAHAESARDRWPREPPSDAPADRRDERRCACPSPAVLSCPAGQDPTPGQSAGSGSPRPRPNARAGANGFTRGPGRAPSPRAHPDVSPRATAEPESATRTCTCTRAGPLHARSDAGPSPNHCTWS